MFRAIIVDDDELSQILFKEYCALSGDIQVVGSFSSPVEALHYAQTTPFELAALDVMMPGLNGLELAVQLRQLNPQLAVMFITASEEFAMEAFRLNASSYVTKPFAAKEMLDGLERAKRLCPPPQPQIFVRTFGHFDVFVNDRPLKFFRQKSKEILAYLVDRQGGMATVEQIINELWEDRACDDGVRACYQVAFKDLRKDLRSAGIEHILISSRNQKAVKLSNEECDLYALINGSEQALRTYSERYMVEYSWAEPTNAYCTQLKQIMERNR